VLFRSATLALFAAGSASLLERRYAEPLREDREKHEARVEIARWLARTSRPGTTIATIAAGYVPFATGLPNVDLAGLTDAGIARSEPDVASETIALAHEKSNAAYVLSRRPEFIEFRLLDFPYPGDASRGSGFALDFFENYAKFRLYPAHRALALSEEFHRHYRLMAYPANAKQVVATFRRSGEREVPAAEALANFGAALCVEGQVDRGLEQLLRAVRSDPRAPLAASRIGRVLRTYPPATRAAALDALGRVYFEAGMYVEAAASFTEAVRLLPASAAYRNNAGFVLIEKLDRVPEGLDLAESAVRLEPENPAFLATYAVGLHRAGRRQDALEVLRTAAARDPGNEEVARRLRQFGAGR
jgi:tetratricopeptide (TPR) repeat protein